MTAGDLARKVLTDLGENPDAPVYYTFSEVMDALNEAQRVFAFLTLCLEKTSALALTPGVSYYHLLQTFPDFLLPLRLAVYQSGTKVRPGRLEDFDARNDSWQLAVGDPTDYQVLGLDLLAITPRPADSGRSLSITFAYSPAKMTSTESVPEIPEEYHPLLADEAKVIVRAKEGGQELQKDLRLHGNFIKGAAKCAAYVAARMAAAGYDRLPTELQRLAGEQHG